jgi:hypothetical protein
MSDTTDDKDARFQAWLDKVCARPMPSDKIARVKTLARELAEGVVEAYWNSTISLERCMIFTQIDGDDMSYHLHSISVGELMSRLSEQADNVQPIRDVILSLFWTYDLRKLRIFYNGNLLDRSDLDFGVGDYIAIYIWRRWNSAIPRQLLLQSYEYIDSVGRLTRPAFDLLSESIPANIFISYHRKSSSALGLLIVARMKAAGMEPFIDMALVPGEAWHAGLQERIKSYDAFILLLAPETLTSEYVIREIEWALEAGVEVIPLWHGKFEYKSDVWRGKVPDEVDSCLAERNAIRVLEESASGYNTAIVELLNRFWLTPD